MKKRLIIYIVGAALLAILGSGIWWYLSNGNDSSSSGESSKTEEEKALDDFFASNTQKGNFDYTTSDGTKENAIYWVKDNLFRIDYYNAGTGDKRISIMTNDGKTAYFCRPGTSVCEPAVGSVESYLSNYREPDGELKKEGYDSEKDCDNFRYVIQKTVDLAGSSNPWYYEDKTYCVKDNVIKNLTSRGKIPEHEDLSVVTFKFTELELGSEIDDSVFELPYTVQNAKDYR